MAKRLYDKLWEDHVVNQEADGTALLHSDRHLVDEVASPPAFESPTLAGCRPWRVSSIVSTRDHNAPTDRWDEGIKDSFSPQQVERALAIIGTIGTAGGKGYAIETGGSAPFAV